MSAYDADDEDDEDEGREELVMSPMQKRALIGLTLAFIMSVAGLFGIDIPVMPIL